MSLALKDLNNGLLKAHYAVRGPIVTKAMEMERSGKKIIWCNIGNPQALGQRPLTYLRQILSLCEYPELLKIKDKLGDLFPSDVIDFSIKILGDIKGGTGAYTESKGSLFVRKAVAEFISSRDKISSDPENIYLTDGASTAVKALLQMIIANEKVGVMVPCPQYPLYNASITILGGRIVPYYLEESSNWTLNRAELEKRYEKAVKEGTEVKAICVINPSNPTGAILDRSRIEEVLKFAQEKNLAVFADEVYQNNIYDKKLSFISFARVLSELGIDNVELFSLHSCSKGLLGECGHRGAYMEIRNMDPAVQEQLTKLQSISLCSNIAGQITLLCLVSPPKEGSPSYELYHKETSHIANELRLKAQILSESLSKIDGIECQRIDGAMYAFPKIKISKGRNDQDYCLDLLKETGICLVPGTGFGQVEGSSHFRTTILPPREDIQILVEKLKEFHINY